MIKVYQTEKAAVLAPSGSVFLLTDALSTGVGIESKECWAWVYSEAYKVLPAFP